jgi:glycosyltransferase involved in cell wall biosynthesis
MDSLKPVLEQIPSELILVDTSQSEEIHRLLLTYTDQVVNFTWCNDFAAARNVGLSQAHGEWFLFLDDDEWFEDVTPILDFFRSGKYLRYHQANYKVRNYEDAEGTSFYEIWVSRMIKREADTHFEGKVHEYLLPARGDIAELDCYVHHYGYVFADAAQKKAHAERNIPLLYEMMREQPENMRWPMHLLAEYYSIRDYDKLGENAWDVIGSLSDKNDKNSNLERGTFYTAVLMADLGKETIDALQEHFDTFIKDTRNPDYVNCSLYKLAAMGAQLNGKSDSSVAYAQKYFEAYETYTQEKKDTYSRLLEDTIIFVCDNVKEPIVNFMRALWATALIFAGRAEEFPREHREAYQKYLDRQIAAGNYEPPQYVMLMAQEGLICLGEEDGKKPHFDMLKKADAEASGTQTGATGSQRASGTQTGATGLQEAAGTRPVLTISLLISNRPDTIPRCLDSLKPIMEQIPSELILVDTSQSEEIHRLLLTYTDQVLTFTWCNDFAAARNAGLSRAHGEWFMFLDDDEWFVETDELIDFFRSGEYRNYDRASYIVRSFRDERQTSYSDSWVSRLGRIDRDTHFEGRIHEYLAPVRNCRKQLHTVANHTGYLFRTEEERRQHFERNSVLLKEMIKEEPGNFRWKRQLVQEYCSVYEWEELYTFSKSCLEELDTADDAQLSRSVGCFYVGTVLGLLGLKRYEEAAAFAEQGLADERMNLLARSYLLLELGEIDYLQGRWEQSGNELLRYLENYAYMQAHEDEWQEQRRAVVVSAAFHDFYVKKAYSLLCCDGLKQKDTANLKKYYPKLEWDKNVIYVYQEFPPVLFEAMSTMPAEEIFLTAWKDIRKSEDLLNRFRTYSKELRKRDGEAFAHLMGVVSEADPITVRLLYAEIAAEENEQQKTAAHTAQEEEQQETAAHRVQEKEQQETAAPAAEEKEQQEIAAPAAQEEEQQETAAHRVQEKEQQETAAHRVQEEMQQMKAAVLDKIPVLLQNGMREDALATVRALRQMFPGDEEIEALLAQL